MTEDGNVRILAARTTDMAREAVRLAGCGGELAQIYSNLLTGAALLELAQAPIDRIQMALEHNGTAGQLLADIWPGPIVRGRIEFAQAGGQLLGDEIRVQVTRQPARGGEPYTSIVDVADGHVANALQQYVLESEQMLTLFTLATVL
ncbi:MAG: redox-regulated HSP33 family molecular chaperone, partial [Myxococcota bacterium]